MTWCLQLGKGLQRNHEERAAQQQGASKQAYVNPRCKDIRQCHRFRDQSQQGQPQTSHARNPTPLHAELRAKWQTFWKEAEQIKAIGDKVLADGDHVDRVQELLRTIRQAAREGDQDDSWIA